MDQIKMGTLNAILTGMEYDPGFMTTEESFLHSVSDDGPWVQLVPEDMVERLAKLTDVEIPGLARQWGETEEFDPRCSVWTLQDIECFLRELVALSRKAIDDGDSVLM